MQPGSKISPNPRRFLAMALGGLISLTVCCLAIPATVLAERFQPAPQQPPTIVPVGTGGKAYFLLGAEPLTFELRGPGTLTGYVRVHFEENETEAKTGRVILLGLVGVPATTNLTFQPSATTRYTDERPGRPSAGQRVEWAIPEGEHSLIFYGDCTDGSDIFLTPYYDGPPQSQETMALVQPEAVQPAKKKRTSRYSFRGQVGLEFAYDSNFLGLSDDYIDEWRYGLYPEKFKNSTVDDFVVSPSIDGEVRRRFLGMGQTRLRAKAQHWQYTNNPIKNNQEFDFYLRQYFGSSKSVELYYTYAPEQYIRMLSDRAPFTPAEDPIVWDEFRFTKNVFGLAYRHRASRRISLKLNLEKNLRYYNQTFIENDIDASEIRGTIYLDPHRSWNFSADYSYEYAKARAVDSVGETPETSDDSDGTYERDLYRLGITWKPRFLRKLIDRVDLSGLLMLYYFPTEKELFDDPYHAGRKDTVYKVSLGFERRLNKQLTVDVSGRYTVRTVDSPWPGDITLDKDYDKYRIWVGFAYKL